MRVKRLIILLLCACAFCFGESCPGDTISVSPERLDSIIAGRNQIYQALKNDDVKTAVETTAKVLSLSPVPEFALDDIELLEIYLKANQFDSAVTVWARIYSSVGSYTRYSYVSDSLQTYLNETYRFLLKGDILDTVRVEALLDSCIAKAGARELRDLALIIKNLLRYNRLPSDRHGATYGNSCHRDRVSPVSIHRVVRASIDVDADTTRHDFVIAHIKQFQKDYPESEFIPWMRSSLEDMELRREYAVRRIYYYGNKFYTGGIGLDIWASYPWGVAIGVPIQFKRFVFTPSFESQLVNESDVWLFTFGYDAFESKHIKVVPFVGRGKGPLAAGIQMDLRLNSVVEGAHFVGEYVAIKFKYMLMYGHLENEDDAKRKGFQNVFYLGAGVFLW